MPTADNGSRRRQLVARVLAEENYCALCDQLVDKTLTISTSEHSKRCNDNTCNGCVPDPLKAEVDEDIPRSRGGSPYDRTNCHIMHRQCNQRKGNKTIAEARKTITKNSATKKVFASPIW